MRRDDPGIGGQQVRYDHGVDDHHRRPQEGGRFSGLYYDVPLCFAAAQAAFQGFSPDSLACKTIIMLRNGPRAKYQEATYPDSRILAVDKEPVICLKLAAGWGDIAFGSSVVSAEAFLKPS